jgi:hypothetical protein
VHACVYIVYNSDLRHWAAINVINGRESLTILILSLAATGITKYSFTHTLALSLSLALSPPFVLSLFLLRFLPLPIRNLSRVRQNAKLIVRRKSSKDALVSKDPLTPL